MSFAQGAPSVNTLINSSNCIVLGNTTSGTALTVQQLGAGAVMNVATSTGSSALFVSSTGQVGIGQTNPQTLLHVTATAANSAIFIDNSITGGATPYNTVRPSASGAGSANCHIWSDGNAVGTSDAGFLRIAAGGGSSGITKSYIDISGYSTVADMNQNIVFGTSGSEKMRITTGGNLGIGTTNPGNNVQIGSPPGPIYGNNPLSQSNVIIFGNSPSMPTYAGTGTMGGTLFVNSTNANASNVGASIALGGRGADFGGGQQHMTFARIQGTQAVTNGAYYGNFVIETQSSGSLYERLRIDQNGYVGIGITNPGYPLTVNGEARASQFSTTTGYFYSSLSSSGTTFVGSAPGTNIQIWSGSADTRIFSSSGTPINFGVNSSGSSAGTNVGIGLTGPSYQLDLSTDGARKLTSTTWLTGSDQRIKTDIQSAKLQMCYDTVKSKDLKYFKWNFPTESNVVPDDKHSLGFIAQEVKTVFPNAVSESNSYGYSDFLSLNTDQILKAMYGALKQTMADKEALEQSLETATAQLQTIEQRPVCQGTYGPRRKSPFCSPQPHRRPVCSSPTPRTVTGNSYVRSRTLNAWIS